MTTDNDEFEKWYLDEYGYNADFSYIETQAELRVWNAAKASSEQRIAELELDIAITKALRRIDATNTVKLQAHINRLRETLAEIGCVNWHFNMSRKIANEAIASTPAESLKAHDAELIDKCIQAIINVGGKRVWEFVDAVKFLQEDIKNDT